MTPQFKRGHREQDPDRLVPVPDLRRQVPNRLRRAAPAYDVFEFYRKNFAQLSRQRIYRVSLVTVRSSLQSPQLKMMGSSAWELPDEAVDRREISLDSALESVLTAYHEVGYFRLLAERLCGIRNRVLIVLSKDSEIARGKLTGHAIGFRRRNVVVDILLDDLSAEKANATPSVVLTGGPLKAGSSLADNDGKITVNSGDTIVPKFDYDCQFDGGVFYAKGESSTGFIYWHEFHATTGGAFDKVAYGFHRIDCTILRDSVSEKSILYVKAGSWSIHVV